MGNHFPLLLERGQTDKLGPGKSPATTISLFKRDMPHWSIWEHDVCIKMVFSKGTSNYSLQGILSKKLFPRYWAYRMGLRLLNLLSQKEKGKEHHFFHDCNKIIACLSVFYIISGLVISHLGIVIHLGCTILNARCTGKVICTGLIH